MTETNSEWSAVEFLERSVTSENGFTATFIDAVEEVVLQAEWTKELERDYKFGAEQMRTLVKNHNRLDTENKHLREAINQSLEMHKWNNEESARILEKALEVR